MVGNTSDRATKFSFIETLDLSKKSSQDRTVSASKPAIDKERKASALTVTDDNTSSINSDWYDLDTPAYNLDIAEIIQQCAVDNSSQLSPKRNYLGKILFALACSYCLFVLWWLFGHQGSKILTALTGGKQVILTKSDVQFIDYMERSLSSIDRIEANLDEGEDDIVYVPMYTPAKPQPQIANNSLPSSIPNIVQPEPTTPQALKIPAPPPLPAATSIPDNPSSVVATNVKTIKHTLMGILELGENQSAALVKVQGKTRRFWVGQEIGNSGWILDSIENQNAKISSQGQVRSISVGETF